MVSHDILPDLAEAYIEDPTVSDACVREFSERVALACAEAPAALRRMIELRPVTAKNAHQYSEFLERALPNWNSDELEREFLDWLERRTSERAVLETIEFRRLCFRRPKQELLLSPSQQGAWEHLHRLADLYFSDTWHRQRIAPNFNVLLAAPSGAGKSFLVGAFAAARGLPLMRLTYSQWIVQGARRQPDTVGTLAAFVARHEQCVLFIDEVDKAGTGESLTDWAAAVAGEVYLTLDRTIFDGRMEGTDKERQLLSARLRRNVMIVVAGTWQWVFRGAGRKVGFAGPADFDPAAAIARAHSIPEELLRRVGGNPVFLQPPSADDLRAMCKAEALDTMARQVGLKVDFEQAVESGDAMRWLSSLRLRLELLRHARVHPHWRAPAPTCRGDGTGR